MQQVVDLQREAGLRSATDGEFRRGVVAHGLHLCARRHQPGADNLTVHFKNADGEIDFTPAALKVDGRIGLSETIFGDDFAFLRDHVADGVTPKLTIPSPSMVHYRGGAAAIDPEVYADTEAFWADLTAAYREQVARVHELGCTYLQLDDTSLAYLNDPEQRRAMADRGEDSEHLHEAYIRHLNEALEGRPDGLTVTTHMCRGNFRDSWVAEGGYDFVAEALFSQLGVDGFFLEYDDERSGGFEPLRHVPKDKLVVLGLVTTKHGELESKDVLKAAARRGVGVRRPRPGLHLAAVRLLLDVGGQLAQRRPGEGQARAARRARRRDLGLSSPLVSVRTAARSPSSPVPRPRRTAGRPGSTAPRCPASSSAAGWARAPSGPRRSPRTSRPRA